LRARSAPAARAGVSRGHLQRALGYELKQAGLPFERERPIAVPYKDVQIPGQRVDLIVSNAVIVEVKAVTHFIPVHQAQLMSYLRTTGIRAGLLMNFNKMLLKEGLKRVVM
jgi:GxxExxY protein